MNIEKFVLGPLATNSYLAWDDDSLESVLIDPGDEGDFLSEQILQKNLHLTHILLTHGHFDHVLGILPIKLNFNPKILLNSADLSIYRKAVSSARHWLGPGSYDPPPEPDGNLEEGSRGVVVGDSKIEIISAPGHTPGGICVYLPAENVLFSGDTLFADGVVGRTDLSYSNKEDLVKSLKKLEQLPSDTIIYPGHGEPDILGKTLSKVTENL